MTRRRGSCGSKWKTFSGCVLAKGFKESGKVAEYNLLTQALLAAGYTVDNFPTDKVRLPGGCYGKSPLENIYGGFEYVCRYSDNFVYKTGCGLYVKGRNVIGNMSTAGIDWCYENDNPVIRCPYDKPDCPQNDPKLYGTQGGGCWNRKSCTVARDSRTTTSSTGIATGSLIRERSRCDAVEMLCVRRYLWHWCGRI